MDLLGRDVTFAALSKSQDFVTRRQELLSENIVNASTPGYKRHDLDSIEFSRMLASSLEHGGSRRERLERVGDVVAREIVQEQLFVRPDHNGVDLAYEESQSAQMTSLASALTALMAKRIQMYKSVIRDGRI